MIHHFGNKVMHDIIPFGEVLFNPRIINRRSQVNLIVPSGRSLFQITKVNFWKFVITLEVVTFDEEGVTLIGLISVIIFPRFYKSLHVEGL